MILGSWGSVARSAALCKLCLQSLIILRANLSLARSTLMLKQIRVPMLGRSVVRVHKS